MKSFKQQTKIVYLKSFTYYWKQTNFCKLFWVPFCCGLMILFSLIYQVNLFSFVVIWVLPFSIHETTSNYLIMVVNEKQSRQKENQLIMGLSLGSYYAGWISSSLTWTCITASFSAFTIISTVKLVYIDSYDLEFNGVVQFFIQFYFFSFTIVTQMFFISSFFLNDQKAAEFYCLFIFMIGYLLFFLDFSAIQLTCFVFPQSLMVYQYMNNEIQTFSLNYISKLIIFSLQGILQIILYIYFDQIMPNEFGKKKTPYFIFSYFKRKHIQVEFDLDIELQQSIQIDSGLINVQQQVLNQDQAETVIIQISQLTKKYNDELVVNCLNLNLYKNQIFTLLGHNGAGKSTAINMICGSIEKDKGNIQINSLDIGKNLAEIRQDIGYCPQKDIIYHYLTVFEHLNYYGSIKIQNKQFLSERIESLLNMFNLQQEKHLIGKKLSSGGKRKLCLAIALIGDPKILILDEPTTGSDPASRQQIWNILKSIKQDKCIILTTHYLDEAEELSDYVGIIQQGKLVVYGTVDQIKKQYSVGFNISIECQDVNHQQQVISELEQIVQETQRTGINIISQNKMLRLNIPQENKDIIAQILEQIESIQSINLAIQMTTLEDAYIKIHSEIVLEETQLQENLDFAKSLGNNVLQFDFLKHIESLVLRRVWIAKENKQQFFFYILFWIMIICFFKVRNLLEITLILSFYQLRKLFTMNQQAYYPLYEKEYKIKQSYLLHGATLFAYWISNLLFDFLIIIFEQLVLLFVLIITNYLSNYKDQFFKGFRGLEYITTIIVNIVFSISLNCQTYFATYFFKTSKFTQVVILFFFSYQFILLIFLYTFKQNNYFTDLLIPARAIRYPTNEVDYEDFGFALTELFSLFGATFHFSLIMLLEYKELRKLRPLHQSDCPILVTNISHKINSAQKLSNISFEVNQKQIFGLLGPHGSGKTQLFDIISRQKLPSEGQIKIKNEETEFGVVPSFSPLHDDLNIEQHLRIYGLIKGLSDFEIEIFIKDFCQIMNLNRIIKRQAKFLSGGERRKLQLGIALIGGSKVLLMDEPTSGVDPLYRQKFQQIMVKHCQINSGSLLFTTQSMSDAQKICDVLGILINGELKFVGTLSQLRELYNNRVQLSFKMNSTNDIQEFQSLIQTNLQTNPQQISEDRNNYYSIFIDGSQTPLSSLFRFCQSQSVQALIDDFEISQVTLDQIYKQYVHQQENVVQLEITGENERRCCFPCCCYQT